ncbi:hypothetical protein H8S61_08745 [Eggerthella sp. NSJ-70]|uniref:DUF2975 domain-containing protein n=1 Tax=Eggerthella hominis TaxID=2763043 RepID=A0ABR7BRQ1_9ACTN|nr:hypothetical protein [Eggerthella hominis]MBC5584283.1 hypothetical protein [Eggerthella hominis]
MLDADAEETGRLLVKTQKICRLIRFAMIVVFVFLCVWWFVSSCVMAYTLLNPELFDNPVTGLSLAIYAVSGVAMAIVCVTLIKIFQEASKGRSPFTMLQVGRLRLVAAALLGYALLEFVMTCTASLTQQGWMGSSLNGAPTLNLFPIVAAGVVFAFSFVFKYGVLLQEFSDDTL